MPTVKVRYQVEVTQEIEWPEDEMDNLTAENLPCNLEPEDGNIDTDTIEVLEVWVDGKPTSL
jgi:hypothetical protein